MSRPPASPRADLSRNVPLATLPADTHLPTAARTSGIMAQRISRRRSYPGFALALVRELVTDRSRGIRRVRGGANSRGTRGHRSGNGHRKAVHTKAGRNRTGLRRAADHNVAGRNKADHSRTGLRRAADHNVAGRNKADHSRTGLRRAADHNVTGRNKTGHSRTGESRMKLGFIGTGNMGNPMAANLIKAGHQLIVHDLRREAATNLLEMGAEWADSPREAAPGNDAVLTSLPVPRDVEAVVLGEDGILEGAGDGTVVFDLSTNSPTVVRNLHQVCAARGVTLLDSPVSGGTYGAAAGTLAVMVGGDRDTFERFEPALGAIGTHVVYCGDIGAGSVCKICNNLMSMGIGVLLSEALTLGVKAGVDLATLADVIAHSSGSSRRLTEKFPRFLFQGNFEPGFATALAAKDVRLATDLGREYGVSMDLSNLVDQRHVEAMFKGFGPEDSDAVARIQEEKAGVQLRLIV